MRYVKCCISCILILLFVSSFGACSQNTRVKSLSEFEEKYRRADYSEFLDDPSEFIYDFINVKQKESVTADGMKYFSDWDLDDDGWTKKKDVVLFNKAASFSGYPGTDFYTVNIKLDTGNPEDNYLIAKAVASKSFELFDAPTEISIQFNDASEAELRRLWEQDKPESFSVSFDEIIVSFYYFATSDYINCSLSIY